MSTTFERPVFPKRAVITAGMPYGNKTLHFGHVGGVFVHADIFARFLRDRIGAENVIFVSGTDCYGATIEAGYAKEVAEGFSGTISDYVAKNHAHQEETLHNYQISLNLFAGSALGTPGSVHADLSEKIFLNLYGKGLLKLEETLQFYDEEKEVFLNGRQVTGRCPIQGCKSEIAYADECALGHQYNPAELINPVSTLSGKAPAQKAVKNWFFNLPAYKGEIEKALAVWEKDPACRKSLPRTIREFLKQPAVYVKKELVEEICAFAEMPPFTIEQEENKASATLVFENLEQREKGVAALSARGIRYRTGKTLVPFRLSGNVAWGIPVPEKEAAENLTFWVWPESLWAPVSFTKAYLGDGKEGKAWENWWKSEEAKVYQFIGEDNIYFYGIAELGLLFGLESGVKLPLVVPNFHLLFGKTKASSSGKIKPPMADELLHHYTAEQLRLHFMNASLNERSAGFEPKAVMEKDGFDSVLYEGNLVTNVFNRIIRSCFYTLQKHTEGVFPAGEVSENVQKEAKRVIFAYEKLMHEITLDKIFELLNLYLRDANKDWSVRSKSEDPAEINQLLIDMFYVVRVCASLFHPIVPKGCEMIREYLGADQRLWNWDYILQPLSFFMQENHRFLFLEPRVDFFKKHPSQV